MLKKKRDIRKWGEKRTWGGGKGGGLDGSPGVSTTSCERRRKANGHEKLIT